MQAHYTHAATPDHSPSPSLFSRGHCSEFRLNDQATVPAGSSRCDSKICCGAKPICSGAHAWLHSECAERDNNVNIACSLTGETLTMLLSMHGNQRRASGVKGSVATSRQ